jgi:formamidopyrimidine-DNA glycosylase
MPELPEVDTIAARLRRKEDSQPSLIGLTILGARLLWDRTVASPTPEEFLSRIVGQKVRAIGRRGKYLRFDLSGDTLLVHLRMTGDLLLEPAKQPIAPHHRLILDVGDGWRLAFNDARKFGRIWLTSKPEAILAKLGPEPLSEDFTAEVLYQRLNTRRRQIKPLLLDQNFLAGLGNIYADESLHAARLHPLTRSDQLNRQQASRLWQSIREVLQEGIRRNGTSIDWAYRGGGYQNHLRVYGRAGLPCPSCGAPIERIVVGQRGTHFCPQCQPKLE